MSEAVNSSGLSDSGSGLLPPGWTWTTLGEAFGINPKPTREIANEEVVTFVPMPAVQAMTGGIDTSRGRRFVEVSKGFTRFEEGDVLFAKITPSMENGKVAVARGLIGGSGCGSTEFHVIRPFADMEPAYAMHFLLQDSVREDARSHMTGTAGQLRVPAAYLASIPLPLAPVAEQHRIVAAIDQQFTRLDAGVASLKRAQANLKRYRASVLKAACEGRLVPTEAELARAEGRDYEHGSVLLERILSERRRRWEEAQETKQHAKGRSTFNVSFGKYKPPDHLDTSELPQLPKGWAWARAEQVCDFITKGTTPNAAEMRQNSGDVPYIKVYNLTSTGILDFSENPTFVDKAAHAGKLARSRVFPNDVLMNIVGPPLGKVSVVPETYREWNVNQAIAIFRPIKGLHPKFLCLCLLSKPILSWAVRRAKATVGQFNLTLELCRDLPLPLPPVSEQQRIVAEAERRISCIDAAEQAVNINLKRAERLRQAILKSAFEGSLVPHDPSDEPASVLLERIKVERDRESVGRPKKRRTPAGRLGQRVSGAPPASSAPAGQGVTDSRKPPVSAEVVNTAAFHTGLDSAVQRQQ